MSTLTIRRKYLVLFVLKVRSSVVSLHKYGYTARIEVFTQASSRSKCNQVTLQRYFWQICILNFLNIDN